MLCGAPRPSQACSLSATTSPAASPQCPSTSRASWGCLYLNRNSEVELDRHRPVPLHLVDVRVDEHLFALLVLHQDREGRHGVRLLCQVWLKFRGGVVDDFLNFIWSLNTFLAASSSTFSLLPLFHSRYSNISLGYFQ